MGMGNFPVIFIVFLLPHVYSAPQLISFNDGKLGVNFAGYHAAVGLGGLLGNGATGGLYAEAGTPHGQSAKAGLGGAVDANGGTSGGLYAGATAGGNVKAGAGLAGGVNGGTSAGTGFATAQAGNRYSSSTLFQAGGNTQLSSNGQNDNNVLPTKNIATNELIPPVGSYKLKIKSSGVINDNGNQDINGLVGDSIDSKIDSPQLIQKRIDIGSESRNKDSTPSVHSVDQITYRKEVNLQRNPSFFEDIFNIPIAALTAVRTFLTNTAGNTSISLQKSGSVQAETDLISPKHASLSSSSSVKSSDTQISVKTPNASQLLEDIIAIPINTLGAVNKFLENNVPARRRVTIQNGDVPQVIRYPGRHARRRAFKKEIIASQEQNNDNLDKIEATN
ncbi:uncharacterized protein LOC106714293 isoform X1 [Papilio machaon]|uniref:uncharacterized protein LOC106714293 isoform X1 n=1 Tax=Papilio machaon TaxID=76193 RepID=UPI001E664060|nr:uncharacterized protein LOC106714293 isoform X1 [Papilio machaon]